MSSRVLIPVWLGLIALAVGVVSSLGSAHGGLAGLALVGERVVLAGWPAAVYLLSAIGLGRLARRALAYSGDPTCLQAGVGLAMQLTLSQVLGQVGLLHGTAGLVGTWALAGLGLALLGEQVWHRSRRGRALLTEGAVEAGAPAKRLLVALLASVPVAILLTASSSPPGWLWDTEFGGFDALSYHLQLPQEWLAGGSLTPMNHNVYSYLPGYVEGAFLHLAAMTGAPATPDAAGRMGLLAGGGWRAISCQMLHAGMTLQAAWSVARMVRRMLVMGKVPEATSSAGAWLAAAMVVATPWTLVVGSLAYNEMAVLALSACAMMAAVDAGPSPTRRGVLSGLLVGVACGAKPTALLLVGAPVGVLLLGTLSPRVWVRAVLPGAGVGLVALLPWLVRNYGASGNPVFPYLSGWFGSGHWTGEQVARYARAHHFSGDLGERLRLAVLPDASDPAGARHRGLMHPQWGVLFPLTLVAIGVGLAWARARLFVVLVALGLLVQLVLWMFTTHIQSRFLLPSLVPCAALAGFAFAAVREVVVARFGREGVTVSPLRDAAFAGLWLPLLAQAGIAVGVFATQRGGEPNRWLMLDPAGVYGAIREELPAGSRLLLVGESAPFYQPADTVYATTWDQWVFGNDQALRALGVTHVRVGFGELDRLARSGFLSPEISAEGVARWLRGRGEVVREDREAGVVVVRVSP